MSPGKKTVNSQKKEKSEGKTRPQKRKEKLVTK
jgi:hypothetical protein